MCNDDGVLQAQDVLTNARTAHPLRDLSHFIQAHDAAGLEVYMTNEQQRNNRALFEACRDGAEEICFVLILFGADVNSAHNKYQETPLFIACWHAHLACVNLLLENGSNVNSGDVFFGLTPLMATTSRASCESSIQFGHRMDELFFDNRCRCMQSLLVFGAAIDHTDEGGWTALMHASWNFKLTEKLLEYGANVNISSHLRWSVLYNVTNPRLNNANMIETIKLLLLVLAHGAEIDAQDLFGSTSLHLACDNLYNPAVVYTLLYDNADIDIMNCEYQTALQCTMSHQSDSPNRVVVLHMMATCAQHRLEASSSDWIRLARNERNGHQLALGSTGTTQTTLGSICLV